MIKKSSLLILALIDYFLVLGFHLLYSILFCSSDQTSKVAIWSLFALFLFGGLVYSLKSHERPLIFLIMLGIIASVTYVGHVLQTLAFAVLIYIVASLLVAMFINRLYVILWSSCSVLVLVAYAFIWPETILLMVPSLFLYYGYIFVYLIGSIFIVFLVNAASAYLDNIYDQNRRVRKDINTKNVFWANISNEIRTPMNVINGMSRLLKTENLNSRAKEYTDQIENASGLLLSIVNDTLELSRIDTGAFKIKDEVYDVYAIFHTSVMYASSSIHSDNINLAYCVNPKVPSYLKGDRDVLLKVIVRLLNNAIIHTSQGEIRMEVDILDGYSKKDTVLCIKIHDRGEVFSEEELEDLFSGFENVDTIRSTESESMGLSLKLCKSMVDLAGGTIKVESLDGHGNTYTLLMPQQITDAMEISRNIVDDNALAAKFMIPDKNILIVDDTPTNLKLIAGMIRMHGATVEEAVSGRECLLMMENKRYDLVFLDYMMPELNGQDTLKQIRQKSTHENIMNVPIIALSSKSLERDRGKFLEMGFDDFISKPVDDKELVQLMKRFLPNDLNKE